jgi:hypothetical protein
MVNSSRTLAIIAAAASLIAIAIVILPPIAQAPLYHAFADARTLYGVPNFWNVISNIPFFLVAIYGFKALRSPHAFVERWERAAYCILLAGAAGVGAGSAYYHLHPGDARLFWDRLPMTVVFMSLVAATVGERIGMRAGRLSLLPLILLGVTATLTWRFSGDLRLYAVVQFGSMLAVPLMLILFPPRYSGAGRIWCTVILYALAKILELSDHQIAAVVATGGHPWKHAAAAAALFCYVDAVARRRRTACTREALPPPRMGAPNARHCRGQG